MSRKVKHRSKTNNNFWKDPKAIISLAIVVIASAFWCGIYYQRTESNSEIEKIRGEYNNTINEERNKHTIEVCKYENEITLLKQK